MCYPTVTVYGVNRLIIETDDNLRFSSLSWNRRMSSISQTGKVYYRELDAVAELARRLQAHQV